MNGGSGGYSIKYKIKNNHDNYGNTSIASTTSIIGHETIQSFRRKRATPSLLYFNPIPFLGAVVDDWKQFRSRRGPIRKGSTRLDRRGNLNHRTLPIKNRPVHWASSSPNRCLKPSLRQRLSRRRQTLRVELAGDGIEDRAQIGADGGEGNDGRDRDQGCDEAIFNRRSARTRHSQSARKR